MTAIVHSQKTGFVLTDKTLNEWIQGGQRKNSKERATTVQLAQVFPVSAYQPLSSHGITVLTSVAMTLKTSSPKSPPRTFSS